MPVDPFIEHLQNRAGTALRVVIWYAEDDFGVLYLRDDLDPDEIAVLAGEHAARLGAYPDRETDPLADRLGPERATVQVRDNAVIVRFPVERDRGIAVGLEPNAARDLTTFVHACTERLADTEIQFRSVRSESADHD